MPTRQVRFVTPNGMDLLVRVTTHEMPEPRRTILLIHGGGEHGGRYRHVMERFAERGWMTIVPDHRGHGESSGPRADVTSMDEYLQDLRHVAREFCRDPSPVVFGHSFGGLLAVRLVETGFPARALVLSAPLLGLALDVPKWKQWLGRRLVRVLPQVRFRTGLDPANMTRDPRFLAERRADRLIQKHVTVRWFYAMQDALGQAHREAGRVTCPIFAVQGLKDRTVDPQALRTWLESTGSTRKELLELPQHVHELLFEADWADTLDRILGWLDTAA